MLGAVAGGVDRSLDAEAAAFKVEIAAEASRNERVAAIVRAADEQGLASLVETLRSMRRARGHRDDDAALAGMAEVVAALFDGLTVRGIRNPGLDRDVVARLIRRIIASFADEPIDAAS